MEQSLWPLSAALAIIITTIACAFVVRISDEPDLSSISSYISASKSLFVSMGILLSVCGTIFFGFIEFWLRPEYALHPVVQIFIIVGYVTLLGLAWIPNIITKFRPSFHALHFASGGVTTLGVIAIVIMCMFSNKIRYVAFIASAAAVIFITITLVLYFVSDIVNRYFFRFEIAAISLLFAAMFCLMLRI